MAWNVGDEISASKLNSENYVASNTQYIGNNENDTETIVRYMHKPASSNTHIAKLYMHALDGWFGVGSYHYVKLYQSNSSGTTGTLLFSKQWSGHQDYITYYLDGSLLPASGWYKFTIQQINKAGGEHMDIAVYGYPMSAISQHELVEYSSTGSRIHGSELSATKLNEHYITTL
jgi:hypothetical protein